jgi:geranylgeranyl diphosphate synthase type II
MYPLKELDAIVMRAIGSLKFVKEPAGLYEPLEYMMSIGGKRLRPRLCLTAFNLFSDDISSQIIQPALALEIFHNFTLLHDDIMDRADTRRGQLTVCRKWNDNVAILSGDVMCILAYKYLQACPAARTSAVLETFTEMGARVCEGQQYDMEFETQPTVTSREYIEMIGLKTAALLACSAKMGALIAGAPDAQTEALYDFGWQIGLAFQICDDYLDTFGNASVFGKKIGGDILCGKKTWLLVEAYKRASGADRVRLETVMALPSDRAAEKISAMQQLYIDLGVKEAAVSAIEDFHARALEKLEGKGFSSAQIARLREFSETLVHRED